MSNLVWELVWEEEYEPDHRMGLWVENPPSVDQLAEVLLGACWRLTDDKVEEAANSLLKCGGYKVSQYHALSLDSFFADTGLGKEVEIDLEEL
ncbi:hypothetical protein GY15_16315 [Delftia sp. 670]|uniref:Uncharacterized protein n=1 Tax=Pseudomonas phage PaP1 TaxID=685892 RepID=G0YV40_9CAUD|nr:hypothetical protein PaP1_gp037 [Pseudomonas phage PaP1]AEK21577.1 hypothetical protein PaP1_gp037 [Pseudomonas phage PaP1]KEH08740.1 hypothetical protein GY14_17815 [Delftia tsuruhatensis]KEH12941.1 hypothetical protein GY15_16315 [Delftia sp. 670]WJJ54445.1 hypothetical protein PT07_00039 [Pseudomonas phage PT07]